MNCHTLMIDDWLMIDEPDDYAGCKCKVQTLCNHQNDDGFYLTVYINGDKGFLNTEVFNEDLRPISLTEEILEQNGFKKINCIHTDNYFYRLTDTEVKEDYTHNTWLIEADKRDEYFIIDGEFQEDELLQGEINNYKIKYVHELQHIFRMLKLKKEIVL